ncbi:hypothetical protein SPYCA_3785 (plasmid) [Sphingopyxis sp. FD7]|nr:hypothetical protein SPYCA_3785 [Sphingopyxis sp. FD7]
MVLSGFFAAAINAVAGGGPVLTLAALVAAGIDPRIANLTSTVALCPGQLVAGWEARDGLASLRSRGYAPATAIAIALLGGMAGAGLLLVTASDHFREIIPWLILIATALYGFSGRAAHLSTRRRLAPSTLQVAMGGSAIYGGYFGGGNSFIVLALLSVAGLEASQGARAKNVLVACFNLGAVTVFASSGAVDWRAAAAVGAGGIAGSWVGMRVLNRIDPRLVRPIVITCGVALAAWFLVS